RFAPRSRVRSCCVPSSCHGCKKNSRRAGIKVTFSRVFLRLRRSRRGQRVAQLNQRPLDKMVTKGSECGNQENVNRECLENAERQRARVAHPWKKQGIPQVEAI